MQPDQSANDEIFAFLQSARRQVVKFIDRHRLMEVMRVRSSERTVEMLKGTGFALTVTARCYPIPDEPALLSLRGVRDNMGLRHSDETWAAVWKRQIWPNVEFFLANEGAGMEQRWHFGYSILCPVTPYIPGSPNPSTDELERFILKVLYEPILRSLRPKGLFTRLV